ncbi:hypothetical protein G3A39_41515 [Paraburkholderia aspalathi]|nr:hypothetical protein [Paraburkholderia aspalathi]
MYDKGTLKGSTDGYAKGTKFEFMTGPVWMQTSDHTEYLQQFMPEVWLDAAGDVGRLRISDMEGWVEVKRIA